MPELPEVETVRRMLEAHVVGRRVSTVRRSRLPLRRMPPDPALPRRLTGNEVLAIRRHGKYLLMDLSGGWSLLSHLGMSGRWLFVERTPGPRLDHVHARIRFEDGTELWFQDPRRFGLLRVVETAAARQDPALASLGPDPVLEPPSGPRLAVLARASVAPIKSFLMDQRRIAGVGNIYASEILHRARVHPARRTSSLSPKDWAAISRELAAVLGEAIDRMGTTFSTYRTLWNEPGGFGDQLRVYERAGQPCRVCGRPIRRLVQANRSSFFCPGCQPARSTSARKGFRASRTPRRRAG